MTAAPKVARGGCICCPGNENTLPMETVLYQGFGGYHVEKDGEIYYWADSNLAWDQFKTLAQIERAARRTPGSVWRVILDNPLRGATWERHPDGWHLIESNAGFA